MTSEDDGLSLPGVTVLVKGSLTGTVTDIDGKYTLNQVPSNAIIVYSFIGMQTIEMPVGGKTILNVSMQSESVGLDEFVVIGYGTVRKVTLLEQLHRLSLKNCRELRLQE